MSSRQIRKLQQKLELEEAAKHPVIAREEISEDEPVMTAKPKASLFASLAALEPEEEIGDVQDDQGTEDDTNGREPVLSPAPKKSKKPKKKKKHPKAKIETPSVTEASKENGSDEIDEAIRALNIEKPGVERAAEPALSNVDPEYERICVLLGISWQHLKVANEMRNLFGKAVLGSHVDAGGAVPRAERRRLRAQPREWNLEEVLKGHHPPGKGLSELILRRNNFIQGKEDWPKGTTGGITMAIVTENPEENGTVEFTYVHDSTYQRVQSDFYEYVEMGDPQNLIELLVRNPYHISLLLQVSKIAKDQSDHALSADLLERALFTFGRAASISLFNTQMAKGKARLDFARPQNRELWLAGYQYMKSLVVKGTYRTALEWAKLLLGLDPEGDPYCIGRLVIHNLAIRANEFSWLLDLAATDLSEHWNSSGEGEISANHIFNHVSPSLAYAAMKLREGKRARELLTSSMYTVPWLFATLFKEIGLDAPPSIWGAEPRTDAEGLFTAIYIQQCKDLWNTPEATSLLMEVAHTISKPNVELIPKTNNEEITLDVVRYVYLDNNPSLMRLTPSHFLHRAVNSDADPLPPDINIISYEAQQLALQPRQNLGHNQNGNWNPLAAFGRLLPVLGQENREANLQEADADDNFRLRGELEAVIARAEESEDAADEGGFEEREHDGGDIPVSVSRRLLNMIWPSGRPGTAASLAAADGDDVEDTPDSPNIDHGTPGTGRG